MGYLKLNARSRDQIHLQEGETANLPPGNSKRSIYIVAFVMVLLVFSIAFLVINNSQEPPAADDDLQQLPDGVEIVPGSILQVTQADLDQEVFAITLGLEHKDPNYDERVIYDVWVAVYDGRGGEVILPPARAWLAITIDPGRSSLLIWTCSCQSDLLPGYEVRVNVLAPNMDPIGPQISFIVQGSRFAISI